jgi:hypothetical protein
MRKRRYLASLGDVELKRSRSPEEAKANEQAVDMSADEITGEARRPDAPREANAAQTSFEVMVKRRSLGGRGTARR